MADDSFLPPVVVTVLFDDTKALAEQDAYKDKLAAMADESDASMTGMGTGAAAAGAAHEDLAQSAAAGAAGVTAGAEDIKNAEKDIESHSEGFSGKIAKIFKSVGGSMAGIGLPFSETVKKMGDDIGKAESKGKGFEEAMVQIGKTATTVGLVGFAALGTEGVKAALSYERASSILETSVRNTGVSYDSVKPKIESTSNAMAGYGFKQQETTESINSLLVASGNLSKALKLQGLAANLARMKNISLAAASQLLAKVYGGSNRALTQMGLNLNVGSSKLATIETATQGVAKAQLSLKSVEAEVTSGKLQGTEATLKLQAAHESLSNAEDKLHKDQSTLGTIMETLEKKTKGMAKAYGTSLKGELDSADASFNKLEISLGKFLIPILHTAVAAMAVFIGFLAHGGIVAHGLEVIIAGPLVLALGFYIKKLVMASVEQVKTFATGMKKAAEWVAQQVASWTSAGDAATAGAAEQSAAADAAATDVTAASAEQSLALTGVGVSAEEAGTMSLTGGAMMAAGIALGTAGIALLVIGIIELVKHWKTVWDTIKAVLGDAISFIKTHIMLIIEILFPMIFWIKLIAAHWKQGWDDLKKIVAAGATAIAGFFSGLWSKITSGASSVANSIASFFSGLPQKIWSFVESIPEKFLQLGKDLIKELVSGVEHAPADLGHAISHAVKKIPVIGGLIPEFAEGGIVDKPTLSVVGEAGPEAIIPLKNLSHDGIKGLSLAQITGAVQSATNRPENQTGGGLKIEGGLNVYGTNASPNQLAQELYLKLRPMLQQA